MIWFWSFLTYSFLGCLLEEAYAAATGGRSGRKGLRVLPLCPVYGAGACLILFVTGGVKAWPPAVFFLGGLAATAAEYCAALYHERVLGVSFWSYDGLSGSLHGRVCLPFSLAWGALSLGLRYWVHPALAPWLARIPPPVGWSALTCVVADGLLTAVLLRRTGDITCLRRQRRTTAG